MAKNKESDVNRRSKTFTLVDYEKKYQQEHEMNDILIKDRFGKDRKELDINNSEQLKRHLMESRANELDQTKAQYRKKELNFELDQDNNSGKEEIFSKEEILSYAFIALQKEKIFLALQYCKKGLQMDENFLNGEHRLNFHRKWNVCIIRLSNPRKEDELLDKICELIDDYRVLRREKNIEFIVSCRNFWFLGQCLDSYGGDIQFDAMEIGLLGIVALFDCSRLMDWNNKNLRWTKHYNQYIVETIGIATEYECQNILTYLESEKAYDKIKDSLDMALHFSAFCGFTSGVRALIKRGANANALSTNPRSPMSAFDIASTRGHLDIVKYFVENKHIHIMSIIVAIGSTTYVEIIRISTTVCFS
jgi:hypothetical protein